MKQRLAHIILLTIALLALGGCTKNNGDIGYWFGLWHVDSIEIDGEPDAGYDGNYYFMFQGKVFCVRYVFEQEHLSREAYARWEESADKQHVTISFADDNYLPFFGNDIPGNYFSRVNVLKVDTLTAGAMVLHHTLDDGRLVTYRLTHWD